MSNPFGRRAGYRDNVISVTQLLDRAGLYDYPPDPSGYYLRRGNFVGDCCDLLASGIELTMHEWEVASREREKPLVKSDEGKVERWVGYVDAYQNWRFRAQAADNPALIEVQRYRYSEAEQLQGTCDQLWYFEAGPHYGVVRLDIKTVSTGPVPKCTELQIALYDLIDELRAQWFLGLALHPDGTFHETWWRPYASLQDARLAIRAYNNIFGPNSRYR